MSQTAHQTTSPAVPLWTPDQAAETRLSAFIKHVENRTDLSFPDFQSLHTWSVKAQEDFWSAVWDFCGVSGDKQGPVTKAIEDVPWTRFFPDSRISYAENCLKHASKTPDTPAIIARRQDGPDRIITWSQLSDQVSVWEQALAAEGIREGDSVGVYLPNIPETVIILLAASNLGAIFVSAGMEMGPDDLINRLGQVNPKILISQTTYTHGAKAIDRQDAIDRVQKEIPSIKQVVLLSEVTDFTGGFSPKPLTFTRRAFNHPLYVLFSSGSTGKPKCFEHSTGGILLKHLSEYQLHCDVKSGDRLFYHATPSWMMWNWLASGLASGATILMYDGSPAYPDSYAQWAFTSAHNCTHHGTAAPVILSWASNDLEIGKRYNLTPLRSILSTGAVLPAQGFEYIHKHIKRDIKIGSISGGTDIVGCFLGGNPLMPTYAGQINGPMLGLDVQVFNEDAKPVQPGKTGELVCLNGFPSMPLRFLNDPDGTRYRDAYFDHYGADKKIWKHGDSVMLTPEEQYVIVGRSDATLNQNGVRIGSSVIYDQLKPFTDQIREAAAVDFTRPDNRQALTVLFLALHDQTLEEVPEELQKSIRTAVKNNVTPYAMPTEIIAVPAVLKTPNGKIAEVVMKKIINGADILNPSLYGTENVKIFTCIGTSLRGKYSD